MFGRHRPGEHGDGAADLAAALAQEIASDASAAVQAHALRLHAAAVARRTQDDDGRRVSAVGAARAASAALAGLPRGTVRRRAPLRLVSTAGDPTPDQVS